MRKRFPRIAAFDCVHFHGYSLIFQTIFRLADPPPLFVTVAKFPPWAKIDARVFSQVPTFLLSIPDPVSFLPKVHCSPGEGRSLKDESLPSPPPFPRSPALSLSGEETKAATNSRAVFDRRREEFDEGFESPRNRRLFIKQSYEIANTCQET